jgi:hypothetical protein
MSTGQVGLWAVTGQVVGEKKWSTTAVSGGGGGGLILGGDGFISRTRITSHTSIHDQIFVRTDDGGELPVELTNVNLAVRVGHRITVVWGIRKGKERGPYLGLYVHDTDSLTELANAELISSALSLKMRVVLAVLAGFVPHLGVFGSILSWSLIASAIGGYVTKLRRKRLLAEEVRKTFSKLISANSGREKPPAPQIAAAESAAAN